MTELKCPFKFGNYDFEGAEDCIGIECGMHNLCNAETEITAVEFDALDEHAQALERENEELQAKVDELTEQLETAHAKNRSLRQHIAKMQDGRHGWHVKGAELQKQVDGLTAELEAARNAHAQAEHEAVILREKLGRMLDNAHEIERIGQI